MRQSSRPVARTDYAGLSGQRRHEQPQAAAAHADDYEQLKLSQLVALCKERGLKSSGNKVHLVNYLRNPRDARTPSKGAKEALLPSMAWMDPHIRLCNLASIAAQMPASAV